MFHNHFNFVNDVFYMFHNQLMQLNLKNNPN